MHLQDRLLELFLYFGGEWIMVVLLGLSTISIGVVLERLVHFARNHDNLERLQEKLSEHLHQDDVEGAKALLRQSPAAGARISLKALLVADQGPASMDEVILGARALEKLRMERGLAFLGTLGNNAPFIGLFGTVLGIIRAFRDLAENTAESSTAVLAGIAEALVATAVGLLVALPAVALFNMFQRRIRSQLAASEALSRVVLAHAKAER